MRGTRSRPFVQAGPPEFDLRPATAVLAPMSRAWLICLLTTVTVALVAPHSAQARTPCAGEQLTPTVLNAIGVNDAVFCLTNQIRASYGLPALRRELRLDTAATLHSVDMATRNFFSHVNPEGLNSNGRAAAQGYTIGAGENIAYGYANARAVMVGWMGSEGHCRNILSSATDLGVGTAAIRTAHYTQVFGNYFTTPVDETPRNGCPYTVNLDTLNVDAPLLPQPGLPADDATDTDDAQLALRTLALAPRRFRAGRRGTTISYTLSAPATVTLRIQRSSGRRYRTMSRRLTRRGIAGANSLRFTGRLGGSVLRPGRYRLLAVAEDADGESTRVARASFVVVRG